jgi:RES domain-containing protein
VLYDRALLERFDRLDARRFAGVIFRHMFGDLPPDRENVKGARWNPPDIPAIYASLSRTVALAEAEFQISLQPVRPAARRTIYTIRVALDSVIDLSALALLEKFDVNLSDLESLDHGACQKLGGAVEWLENDGLLVPSARADGTNLVIFPNRQKVGYEFEILDQELIESGY